jgi:photoactive yellow protein
MTLSLSLAPSLDFHAPDLFDALNAAPAAELEDAPFGVVRMNAAMEVLVYNRTESMLSGLDPTWVRGKHFFSQVAPCIDNHMVAAKFRHAIDLDESLDYVLAFQMRPTRVKLRLLKRQAHEWSYVCVLKL